MILIADSGSTKCDWSLIDESGKRLGDFRTMGLNPYFHDAETTENALRANPDLMLISHKIQQVYFYGAGSSTPEMCAIMHEGISSVFKNAHVVVDHDQLGSAMAVYDGEPCIACILGTGSNSCHFDGKKVYEEIPSLAYILGDEGSGSYFGKILLREYFYKHLPKDIATDFENEYKATKNDIINNIYRKPNANVYLASFMTFIGKHKEHPHVLKMVKAGMIHFIDIHVKCFPMWREVPVHFVGSIGEVFRSCLDEACAESGVRLGKVVRKPIDGLIEYHLKYVLPHAKVSVNK